MGLDRETLVSQSFHALDSDEVLVLLNATKEGLDDTSVSERLNTFGENNLPGKKQVTLTQIILHQVLNPLIFILIAATIASLVIQEYTDAIFILVVILLNTFLGAYQEFNAEKSASSLQKLLKIKATVKRNGRKVILDSEELVPGDLVYLESGNKVPADLRLIELNNFATDESFLTGESVPIQKNIIAIDESAGIGDRKNMAFAGGTVLSGRALGVVVATGLQTQVGVIAKNVRDTSSAKPPLVIRMERFTRNISIIVLVMSFLLAFLLYFQGYDNSAIFFFVVALAVSAIPEGLPVALTVVLSLATKRMSKRNVIVRKLNAVESLGSCSVIASDKTGTLTVNQQTVRQIHFPDSTTIIASGEGYNGEGKLKIGETQINANDGGFRDFLRIAILANEGKLTEQNGVWEHIGDSMDVALLAIAYKTLSNPLELKKKYELVEEIPYESEKKYSAAIHQKDRIFYHSMKGAVETIVETCTKQWNYSTEEYEILDKENIFEQVQQMAAKGLRVLGFAGKQTKQQEELSEMVFYGLAGFIDPLRPEAIEAVKVCKDAGIRVLMITGDHPSTAGAISLDLGLTDNKENVVTGSDLTDIDNLEFTRLVDSSNVFARVSPTQKLEIVDNLISRGEFVAVTGDGVNDTPALRRANIGVAMGSGTDVAKEVGSMIVVDDNFSSIVAGVEEGRFAFDNVRKVIYLLISCGLAEVLIFVASIIAGLPLPLLAVQLLWLNLVTNGIQDVALAFEGGEPGAMKRKPRRSSEAVFDSFMIRQTFTSGIAIAMLSFGLWYYLIEIVEMDEHIARNELLLLMVLIQNVHVFNCRSERTSAFKIPLNRNYMLIFGVLAAQLLHIGSMQIPFMQNVLGVGPIPFDQWLICLGLAISVLIVMEVYKLFLKKS